MCDGCTSAQRQRRQGCAAAVAKFGDVLRRHGGQHSARQRHQRGAPACQLLGARSLWKGANQCQRLLPFALVHAQIHGPGALHRRVHTKLGTRSRQWTLRPSWMLHTATLPALLMRPHARAPRSPACVQENMYRDMVTCGDVTQLALLHGKCIGAIGCRLQMAEGGTAKLYVLTLGVLAPYRNAGIGARSRLWRAAARGVHMLCRSGAPARHLAQCVLVTYRVGAASAELARLRAGRGDTRGRVARASEQCACGALLRAAWL